MQTKNFQQLQPECQHVAHHVHFRNYSQTAKSPKRIHLLINIVQQCPPVEHDKDEPKNRDGKGQDTVTENRKTPANHPDGTTEVLKVHIRRFAAKEQYKVKNCRKGQRPSVRANWIPGGHLRFQRLSNSKPWQNAVESQAKNKSSLAKCLGGTGLCQAIRSEIFKIQVLPTLPTTLTSPLLRLATAAYAEKYGSMTSRWCRVLAPILPLSRG